MLSKEVRKKLKELRILLVEGSCDETVGASFFLNANGWNTSIEERSADSLRNEGISMRNLKGDFIN